MRKYSFGIFYQTKYWQQNYSEIGFPTYFFNYCYVVQIIGFYCVPTHMYRKNKKIIKPLPKFGTLVVPVPNETELKTKATPPSISLLIPMLQIVSRLRIIIKY